MQLNTAKEVHMLHGSFLLWTWTTFLNLQKDEDLQVNNVLT